MTREEAISLYIKHSKSAQKTIKRLIEWDESLDIKGNAKKFGVTYQTTASDAFKYGLKYQKYLPYHNGSMASMKLGNRDLKDAMIRSLRKEGFLLKDIAKLFGTSKQRIQQII